MNCSYRITESDFLKFIEAAPQLTKLEFRSKGWVLTEDLLRKIASIRQLHSEVMRLRGNAEDTPTLGPLEIYARDRDSLALKAIEGVVTVTKPEKFFKKYWN